MRLVKAAGLLPAALLAAALTGCGSPAPEPASKEPLERYSLHGEVVRLDAQGSIATIRHRKIEGYMEAMTMQFPVKEPRDFAGLHPGDCIDATLFLQGLHIWIGEIVHQPAAPGTCVAPNHPTVEQTNDSKKTP